VITVVSAGRRGVSTGALTQPPLPAYTDSQIPVDVKVRAAVESGELFVNGQSYGPVRLEEAIQLRLAPGAYYFEAREVDGTQVGKDVLVEPGSPREVVLIPPTD
jgi:hypothetical protein